MLAVLLGPAAAGAVGVQGWFTGDGAVPAGCRSCLSLLGLQLQEQQPSAEQALVPDWSALEELTPYCDWHGGTHSHALLAPRGSSAL